MKEYIPKKTQGEIKMERYIEDLIRNKDFLKKIKRLRKNTNYPEGMYDTWTDEERQRHDYINKEFGEIIEEYKKLRKRTNKLMSDDYWRSKMVISEIYNLDNEQINYTEALLNPKKNDLLNFSKSMAELDMCKIADLRDSDFSSIKGEAELSINPRRDLLTMAYPVGLLIHPKASKRDVLDYIEKRWNWIENNFLRSYSEKKLKYGKRKYDQKILDFLWNNRFLPSKKLKEKLDDSFPKNGLVYYEIVKILQLEKTKRLGSLS
ncbi:MAG: hypothetical protein ACKOW9_01700 [Candidatus Paceibacterota bacterium]